MPNQNLKKNIISGFIWSVVGHGGHIAVNLISNIVLARILSPYEFGQVGIIMFFIMLSMVLTESGLSGALIRKNDVSEDDFSTIFTFNFAVSTALMLLMIIFSEAIADFYDDSGLKPILIAASSILIINSFQIIQKAKLVKNLQFRKKAIYEFLSIMLASVIGITLAILDAGVWSMIVMQIASSIILTSLLWWFEGSVKLFIFNVDSFRGLYKFGMYTTLASLLNTVFENIYQLILGKYFTISQTGLFYQAKKLQEVPVGVIKSTTAGVVFSALSKVQNDPKQFNYLYNRIVTMFTIIVGLICLLIFFYAQNIVTLLYGERWIDAVGYMKILIVGSYFFMQEMFNRVIFKIFDKTEKIFYLEIIKKSIQLLTILIGVFYKDIELLLYGFILTSFVSFIINYYVSRKVQDNFSWYEFVQVFKVALICVIAVGLGSVLEHVLGIGGYYSFMLIPILLLVFIFCVHFFNVSDILADSKLLFRFVKK
jgi:teichuronic acid exporter